MSAATQRILLYKLKETLTLVDEVLKETPTAKSSVVEWERWKERLDTAEVRYRDSSPELQSDVVYGLACRINSKNAQRA